MYFIWYFLSIVWLLVAVHLGGICLQYAWQLALSDNCMTRQATIHRWVCKQLYSLRERRAGLLIHDWFSFLIVWVYMYKADSIPCTVDVRVEQTAPVLSACVVTYCVHMDFQLRVWNLLCKLLVQARPASPQCLLFYISVNSYLARDILCILRGPTILLHVQCVHVCGTCDEHMRNMCTQHVLYNTLLQYCPQIYTHAWHMHFDIS